MAFTVVFTPKDEEFANGAVDQYVATILKKLNKKMGIELRA
jgi:phenylalanyl-tRNA synthetase beta chain